MGILALLGWVVLRRGVRLEVGVWGGLWGRAYGIVLQVFYWSCFGGTVGGWKGMGGGGGGMVMVCMGVVWCGILRLCRFNFLSYFLGILFYVGVFFFFGSFIFSAGLLLSCNRAPLVLFAFVILHKSSNDFYNICCCCFANAFLVHIITLVLQS